MRVLELFSGTESFSKACRARGHETFTIDNDPRFNADLTADVMKLNPKDILGHIQRPDIIWASPPCTAYSVLTISHNWRRMGRHYLPKTDDARNSIELIKHTLFLLDVLKPTYWFMENPRAMLRKMAFMKGIPRVTVTYCQYGHKTQKPTDIWGNRVHSMSFKPPCKRNSSCHEAAPRGSRSGIQGIDGRDKAMYRAVVPAMLCASIIEEVERLELGKGFRQTTLREEVLL